jgi:hypothetical protein
MEIEALPGMYSDLTFAANAYLPVSETFRFERNNTVFVREALAHGADARIGLLLPAMVDALDARVDAGVYTFHGEATELTGYSVALTMSSRDGMLSASCAQEQQLGEAAQLKLDGKLTLVFDWAAVLQGKNPFTAPYQRPSQRYSRAIQESLRQRVVRNYDTPKDRSERIAMLNTRVVGDMVSFCGAFPEFPNAKVVVQTAQSPWFDHAEVSTDSKGFYLGRVKLPPGSYRLRLVHKPTGRASQESVVEIKQ